MPKLKHLIKNYIEKNYKILIIKKINKNGCFFLFHPLYLFLTFLIILFSLLFNESTSADYFKYKGENGNICFTDDLSKVPKQKREKIKTFDSGNNVTVKSESLQQKSLGEHEKIVEETQNKLNLDKTPDIKAEAEAIEMEKQQLASEREKLLKRQQNLKNKSVGTMGPEERLEFINKAEDLNREIKEYEKRRQNFSEKVKNYNNKVTNKNASIQ
ncbi:DUF4124 domain-containing protein [Desulfobacter sp.]